MLGHQVSGRKEHVGSGLDTSGVQVDQQDLRIVFGSIGGFRYESPPTPIDWKIRLKNWHQDAVGINGLGPWRQNEGWNTFVSRRVDQVDRLEPQINRLICGVCQME